VNIETQNPDNLEQIKVQNLVNSLEGLLLESSRTVAKEFKLSGPDLEQDEKILERIRLSLVGSIAEQTDEYVLQLKKLEPDNWQKLIQEMLERNLDKFEPPVQEILIQSLQSYQ